MAKLAIVIAALVLPVSGAGWDYASPNLALSNFKDAFQRRDASAVAAYIDFPTLRENLKSGMRARYASNALSPAGGGLDMLSDERKFAAISRAIDSTVTPAGLDLMFAKAAETGDGGTPQNGPLAAQAATTKFVIHRTAWGEFEVVLASGYPFGLIFTRENMSWKLTNARLPADLASAFARPPTNPSPYGTD
jgi:hypothetical protein